MGKKRSQGKTGKTEMSFLGGLPWEEIVTVAGTIVLALFLFGLTVAAHEFGHFWAKDLWESGRWGRMAAESTSPWWVCAVTADEPGRGVRG